MIGSLVRSRKNRRHLTSVAIYAVLTAGALFWLFPFVWMFLASIKPTEEIYTRFWPTRLTLEHYRLVLQGGVALQRPFLRAFFNTLFVASVQTAAIVFIGAITGYALGRLEFRARDALFNAILYQMIFPGILFLIPTFLLVLRLNLINTYAGMIVRFLTDATGVFLFTQFFKTIPQDLIDAARMDGAGEFTIIWRIMIPLSASVTAFVAIFNFMARWDEFLWNLIVVRDYDLMTLPVLLAVFTKGEYGDYPGAQMAAATILTLPILLLFMLFRRYFEEGIVTTGLKG